MKKTVMDDEEKDILEAYGRGEWVPVENAYPGDHKENEYLGVHFQVKGKAEWKRKIQK